jgi:sulfonate transport system substrate-binding protein
MLSCRPGLANFRQQERQMRLGIAAAAALAMLAAAPARADGPLVIRHGYVAIVGGTLSPLIFAARDVMAHYGKSYTVDAIHFAGTSQELTAIAAGEVDIITIAYSSLGIAVENAHLDDLRIVADGFQDGAGDYVSSPYLVRNDGGIKTVEDLKGKVMVVNVLGAAVDLGGRAMLKQHGLDAGKDYTVIEAEFPTMGAMLLSQKADLIADVPPFSLEPKLVAGAHVLFHMKDSMGPSQMIMLAARAPFLDKNRAALGDFFADYAHGLAWILDPANREAAIALAAAASKLPPERLRGYYLTKDDYYRDPRGLPDLKALQRNIDTQYQLGFLKSEFDAAKYADLSFMERASAPTQ